MRCVKLLAVCDEYDNEPGLIAAGTKMGEGMSADRDGTLLAHDILEHQNGVRNIGPIDDELEALGGVMQVRGRHGDMCSDRPQFHSIERDIAADITRMVRELDGFGWWPAVGKYRTQRHDYDDDFREAIRIAREDIPGEFEPDELRDVPVDAYLDNALHLMRRGFRKAQRRFGTGYMGIDLFKAIKRAVKATTIDYEGQEFRLSYGGGNAYIEELHVGY